jgi:hypothetical protein
MIEKLIRLSPTQLIFLYSAMTSIIVQVLFINIYKSVSMHKCIGYIVFSFLSLICYYKMVID